MTSRFLVGIDLGTKHTVVAFSEVGSVGPPSVFSIPQLVTSSETERRPLLPSVLYAPLDAERVVDPWGEPPWIKGDYARQRGTKVTGRSVSSAKSWLCHGGVDRLAAILPWGQVEGTQGLSV